MILYHGSNISIQQIDLGKCKPNKDFGKGFYLGEKYEQAANYISNFNNDKVYAFRLDTKNLKFFKFNVDNSWMIAIAYYRGWLKDYEDHKVVRKVLDSIKDADVIIAPIADNRMFDIINEFIENFITDEQCRHALAATNLGFQYHQSF